MSRLTRRDFLAAGTGLAGAAAVGAVGSAARGESPESSSGPKRASANDRVNIGVIGCGQRGKYLINIFQKIPAVRIGAVCDVHRGHVAEARKLTADKAAGYGDYRKLLEEKSVDAVIVATTGHWHVLPGIDACASGRDVYTEKPAGTSIAEGRALVSAAKRHNRIVQIGTQQRTWQHYADAVEIVRSGKLGNISHVHVWDVENFWPGYGSPADTAPPPELDWEFFLGPAPKVPYNENRYLHHYHFFDYGGCWQLDWAVHHYDIVHWAMGVDAPLAATASGGKFAFPRDNTQWPDTLDATCEYGPGPVAKAGFLMTYTYRGGCNHLIEGRPHGKAFYGSDGVLVLSRKGYEVYSQERKGKKVIEERQGSSVNEHQAVLDHTQKFVESLRTRRPSNADIEVGHMSSNPGHLMNIAWRVGRRVKWYAAREQIVDDPQAGKWLGKEYRGPWKLPT